MPYLIPAILDAALIELDKASAIYICSSEPTTYTAATSTLALGTKSFGVGGCFGAPAARSPNGRKAASTAITDGSVTASGTAAAWAAVEASGSRLMAAGALASSQAVTSGNTFTLASFDVGIPAAV